MAGVTKILDDIIQDFSIDKFNDFFYTKSDNYFPKYEKLPSFNNDQFTESAKIGECAINNSPQRVIVFSAKVTKDLTQKSGKKAQYVFAKNVLKQLERYFGGFFIFYDSNNSFRLSFIYSIPRADGRQVWSNFRRFTYYVSKEQTNRTFLQQMQSADFNTFASIAEAFSVEKVTKEFYQKVVSLYYTLLQDKKKGIICYPNKDEKNKQEFGIRLLGRLVFCWFLKKKRGDSNCTLIPDAMLSSQVVNNYEDFYHELLEPLFFQVLNTPIELRLDDFKKGDFAKVPFLNGGLFEPHDGDMYKPNEMGISQFINTLKINNNWFKEVFELFEMYNFTIDENTADDAEISIDPEMLGKIFENLLAEITPETGESARRATGSYYTPRIIVDYMVNESLKHYLIEQTGLQDDIIEKLLQQDDEELNLSKYQKDAIITALDEIKVLDPACGSGAFPMGMLHKMVTILQKVDPNSQKWLIKKLERIPDPLVRKELEQKIQGENWDYIHKLGIIQNSIYGVDIQTIAIEISKLRFFLSLIVDEKIYDSKPNRGIIPLPNLEFKIVSANTLIELDRTFSLMELNNNDHSEEIDKIYKELQQLRMDYFTSYGDKSKVKNKFIELQKEIFDKSINWIKDTSYLFQLSRWDPFSFESNSWFDPEWMFGVTDGFDIVIGNPPYIQLQKAYNKNQKYADLYKNQNYEVFDRMGDIYCLFYEKGIQLLKQNGILAYITSNKWMRAGYGEKLRDFFTKYNPLQLVDLGPGVFENATVDTNILIIQKTNNQKKLKAVTLQKEDKEDISKALNEKVVLLTNLTGDAWFIGSDAEQRLKEKIESIGKPLKDWDVKIYRGVLTGLNEAFIITTEKRNEILANCQDKAERRRTEAIIKPILRGRDIKRYYYEWAGLWVIGTFPALRLNIDDYPALKKYFFDNFDIRQLEQSGKKYPELGFDARKKTGNKWFETQDQIAYYPEFEKEKVVWAETDQALNTVIVDKGIYLQKTCFMIITLKLKFISAILNSSVSQWYIRKLSSNLGNKGLSLTKDSVKEISLPPITPTNEPIVKQIEALVDKILAAKKQNPQKDTGEWEREIDRLVYRLYDLTEEEVRIVEGGVDE